MVRGTGRDSSLHNGDVRPLGGDQAAVLTGTGRGEGRTPFRVSPPHTHTGQLSEGAVSVYLFCLQVKDSGLTAQEITHAP